MAAVVQRCTNPNAVGWEYYGGRGITVCEPGNCRWATAKEQRANQRPRQQSAAA